MGSFKSLDGKPPKWALQIFNEVQRLQETTEELQKLQLASTALSERRVGRDEFARMLNIEPETLDARVRDGRYIKPLKDGRKSYWLLSYVQTVVTTPE